MKKIIFVIAILLCATFCLTSCDLIPVGTTDVSYQTINKMINSNYSKLAIEITTKPAGESDGVVSKIDCISINDSVKMVSYSIQQYAIINVDGDTITLPESQIVSKDGSVVITNGDVTTQQGDKVDFDFSAIDKLNISFSDKNLSNVTKKNGVLTANVTDVSAFLGVQIQGVTNAKVSADVVNNVITLSGTANGSDFTVVYTITK